MMSTAPISTQSLVICSKSTALISIYWAAKALSIFLPTNVQRWPLDLCSRLSQLSLALPFLLGLLHTPSPVQKHGLLLPRPQANSPIASGLGDLSPLPSPFVDSSLPLVFFYPTSSLLIIHHEPNNSGSACLRARKLCGFSQQHTRTAWASVCRFVLIHVDLPDAAVVP